MCAQRSDGTFIEAGVPKPGEVRGAALRSKLKTHCDRGHPLSGENLVMKVTGNGEKRRACRTCAQAYGRMAKGQARQARLKKKVGPPLYGCI